MKVKLIIANTQTNTVFFNYGDDYSDIARVFVEDHSPWEEVDDSEYYNLVDFVNEYNRWERSKLRKSFAFLVVKDEQISAQCAIDIIVKKRADDLKKQKEEERVRKELAEKKKQEANLKKLAKTKEQKLKLFEQLKEELNLDVLKFKE